MSWLLLAAALPVAPVLPAAALGAQQRDSTDRDRAEARRERVREQQEREREQQERERDRQREQQERDRERQREARERTRAAREAARRASRDAREDDDEDDRDAHHRMDAVAGVARLDTTVALAADGTVDLTLVRGTIVVTAWERAEARVSADAGTGRVRMEHSAGRLALESGEPGRYVSREARRRATGAAGDGEPRFEVVVPRGVTLRVETTSGQVRVNGVRGGTNVEVVSGDVRLEDVAGRITVEVVSGALDIRGADGELHLEVASGNVEVSDVAGRLDFEGVSGNVTLRGARLREVGVETMSGNVTYDGTLGAEGRYALRTHSGNVRLALPGDARARLDIQTYNGTFVSDRPVGLVPGGTRGERQTRFTFDLGEGGGPTVVVETFSGNVHLVRPDARPIPRSQP